MLQVLEEAAREGGSVLRSFFQKKHLDITHKTGHHNFVTMADLQSQGAIQQKLITLMRAKGVGESDVGFIGEENLYKSADHMFIIDPLDGTSNFATGLDQFAVIIAYSYKKEVQAGVMYFPVREEWYMAEKGKGAYAIKQNEKRVLQAVPEDLKNLFVFSSISYSDEVKMGIGEKLMKLKSTFRGVRMIGCAATELAWLSDNIAGLVLLAGCSIWDIAPGKIILEEAGFAMYDWDGNDVQYDFENPTKKYPFFACHPSKRDEILTLIKT